MKAYAYLAAILTLLGALWGVYHMGGASCRENAATAARGHLEAQNRLLAELEEAKQNREVIFRDKIRVVRESTADCLGVPMPDDVRLQLSGGGKAKPAANP